MARNQKEIAAEILEQINNEPDFNALDILTEDEKNTVASLTSTSRVSPWRLLIYVVSSAIAGFEFILEVFRKELEARIATTRVHTKAWYRELALSFQLGMSYDVITGYDNTGLSAAQIEATKVVKYAAVTRLVQNNAIYLRIKTANDVNGELVANTAAQLTALTDYIEDNTDAGTLTIVSSGNGDDLKLVMKVWFNPQIIDSDGKRIDGDNDTPLIQGTNEFLKSVEFNGRYIKRRNEDAITAIDGIEICEITLAASKHSQHDYTTTGIANAGEITDFRIADSGYFKLDLNAIEIQYLPFNE